MASWQFRPKRRPEGFYFEPILRIDGVRSYNNPLAVYLIALEVLLPLQSKTTEKARQLQAVWQNNDSVANDYRFVVCGGWPLVSRPSFYKEALLTRFFLVAKLR